MDQRITESVKERSRRPIRNKRYNRRSYAEDKRPPKRLFTPEIKRFLKDWLVRRRDNPYPNREEKKTLAVETGLTYIQVCNWFANWRRKLKNAGKEPQRKTWGHLIKSYNSQVHGNVEHFSISSEDSIWHEREIRDNAEMHNYDCNHHANNTNSEYETGRGTITSPHYAGSSTDSCCSIYETKDFISSNNNNLDIHQQYLYINSKNAGNLECNPFAQHKYKNHIMEKYLRDCQKPKMYSQESDSSIVVDTDISKPSMISKWLQSAANFRPSENNYLNWTLSNTQKKKCRKTAKGEDALCNEYSHQHGREELDAAEALTKLASAHSALHVGNSQYS